jgi:hypothetical protein
MGLKEELRARKRRKRDVEGERNEKNGEYKGWEWFQ